MLSAGIKGYSGARGVLGALRARAPRPELVRELLELPGAEACVSRLQGLAILGERSGGDLAELERDLRYGVLRMGRRLAYFVGGGARGVLDAYLMKYDLQNLKTLFRAAVTGNVPADPALLYPEGAVYGTDRELASLDTPEKVVEFPQDKRLARIARDAFEDYKSAGGDLFRFELALDRQYLQALWDASGHVLPPEQGRLRKRIILPLVGTTAFVWALWLKRYHRMGAQELMQLLPMPDRILETEAYQAIAAAEDVSAVPETALPRQLRTEMADMLSAEPHEDVSQWQRLARRFVWSRLRRRPMGPLFDITTILEAFLRWEYVIEDAITVTNAKALGLEREAIEPLLATRAA